MGNYSTLPFYCVSIALLLVAFFAFPLASIWQLSLLTAAVVLVLARRFAIKLERNRIRQLMRNRSDSTEIVDLGQFQFSLSNDFMSVAAALVSIALLCSLIRFDGLFDSAKNAAAEAKDKVADMASVDFGDFDMKSLRDKMTRILGGFEILTPDNVDVLISDITKLSESIDDMEMDKLKGPGKTYVGGMISKFDDAVMSAMQGISDELILTKLKPSVTTLIEKLRNCGFNLLNGSKGKIDVSLESFSHHFFACK